MNRGDRILFAALTGVIAVIVLAFFAFRAAIDDSSDDLIAGDRVLPRPATNEAIEDRSAAGGVRRPPARSGAIDRVIRGRVVRRTDRSPVPDARVALVDPPLEDSSTMTGADGRFVLALASPSTTHPRITVSAKGYARFSRILSPPMGDSKLDLGTIELDAAAAIEGVVLDMLDRPLSDVVIALFVTPVSRTIGDVFAHLPEFFESPTPTATTRSSADGSFRFEDLDEGTYDLEASRGDFARTFSTDIRTSAGRTTRIVDLRLETAVPLDISIVGADGAPISGASVIVFPAPAGRDLSVALERHHAITGEGGRVVVDRLATGNYMVMAMDDQRRIASRQSVPAPGSVTIAIGEGVVMNGLVRLEHGGRVPGRLSLTFVAGDQFCVVEPDADGRYAAGPFRPGKVRIMVKGLEEELTLAPGVEGVSVLPDASAIDHDIVIVRGATVSGRVLDATTKAPIADATVISGDGPLIGAALTRTTTDGRGHFTLRGVRATHNEIFARADGYGTGGPAEGQVLVAKPTVDPGRLEPGGVLTDVTLELLRLFRIKGRILDQMGNPVAGVRVTGGLRSTYESALLGIGNDHVVTGSDGRYDVRVDIERPAFLRIRAEHVGYFTSERRLDPTDVDALANDQDIVLERNAVLTGTVRDVSGVPVSGIHVIATPEAAERRGPDGTKIDAGDAVLRGWNARDGIRLGLDATTSADGNFTLRVPDRPTTIRIQDRKYCMVQGPAGAIEPRNEGPTRVPDVFVCRTESAVVTLATDLRNPLTNAWVRLDRTGPDGYAFRSRELVIGHVAGFSMVPIGSYTATVEIDDPEIAGLFSPGSLTQRIDSIADADRRHTLRLEFR